MTIEIKPVVIERRKNWHTPESCPLMNDVQNQFSDGSDRMRRIEENVQRVADHQVENEKTRERMEQKLDTNTELTQQLLSIIQAGKGFFRVMGWVVEAAKWIAGVVVAFGSVWYLFKDHHK